ncbi:hypothetical protein XELAEV_18038247mg [Xenopus laevis]|uniref:Fibrinogen C-terminal domain-containing protein n=1 Tax=Xenopus laevis TaxID=8355 RepID=A0A974H750_XENLA|nr:hypothetical protein XELAEV_18038247mg [Xenopus laevis]
MTGWLQSFLLLVAASISNRVDTHPLPQNCMQWMNQGDTISGWYLLDTLAGLPLSVFCDMDTDGGGWIKSRRVVDFFRDWNSYKRGFGHKDSEFWLGNDNLHLLTATGNFQLRIDLTDFSDKRTYATYSNFHIDGESQNYTLHLTGFTGGNAGNALSEHNGYSFSTKDRDNDIYEGNCAQQFKGAWWYTRCHLSNLNGLYLHGDHTSYADGVNWSMGKGLYYSYKVSEMKFRPQL